MKRIHFIGICGYAMSGVAVLLKKMGHRVTGSDEGAYPPVTQVIEREKIQWTKHFHPQNLGFPDLVVIGNHIREDNPEAQEALKRSLKVISLPELIRKIFADKKRLVIAGTHGKTTTTAMISWLLTYAGLKPSYLVGGVMKNTNNGFNLGQGDLLVIEGDEYRAAFFDPIPKIFHYQPEIAILTSCEMDHPDYFKNFQAVKKTFWSFLKLVPKKGLVVAGIDDVNVASLFKKINRPKTSFGLGPEADYQAVSIDYGQKTVKFKVKKKGRLWSEFSLLLPGEINVRNALAAIVVADYLGVSLEKIRQGLVSFQGVKRRFEVVSEKAGMTIIDDYAHHPTKIKKTLAASRTRYRKKKIYCVFEPHTYSRTKTLLADYGRSFSQADEVIIAQLMPAREKEQKATISSQSVVKTIRKHHSQVKLIPQSENILGYLGRKLRQDEVVIIMSVGGLNNLAGELALWQELSSSVRLNESLKEHTTFGIGGPADLFLAAKSAARLKQAVKAAKKLNIPYFVLGGGSNLLVSDQGFRGLVIKCQMSNVKCQMSKNFALVEAESGLPMNRLIQYTIDKGLTGLENFWGLPGTVGGAVSGQAHFWQETIKPAVKKINKIDDIILSVVFKLKKGNKRVLFQKAQAALKYRQQTQPLTLPSAGCIFKNPSGQAAGYLIEQCGLKGKRQGGAMIARKHANFIVNTGQATGQDVVRLIELVKKKVKEKFGIELEEEIVKVGENYE